MEIKHIKPAFGILPDAKRYKGTEILERPGVYRSIDQGRDDIFIVLGPPNIVNRPTKPTVLQSTPDLGVKIACDSWFKDNIVYIEYTSPVTLTFSN